jgi:hypothetical protein
MQFELDMLELKKLINWGVLISLTTSPFDGR